MVSVALVFDPMMTTVFHRKDVWVFFVSVWFEVSKAYLEKGD